MDSHIAVSMAYAIYSDAIALHGERKLRDLSDHDRDGEPDLSAIERALEDDSALADSYLAIRYAVPVNPVPDALRAAVVEMACYRLANTGAGYSEDLRRRYEDAIRFLRDVAGGRADLPGIEPRDDSSGVSLILSAFSAEEVAR